MKEIITWGITSSLLFVCFIVVFLVGILKRRKDFIAYSVFALLLSIATATWCLYIFTSKSYHKTIETFQPRTGDEIYTALFGKPQTNCVTILHYQDQFVPVIDYAIWLHFKTCPNELKRVIEQHPFAAQKVSTSVWHSTGPLANKNWFKPEQMGDTVLKLSYRINETTSGQDIYSSLDSTEIYCQDFWN